MRGGKSFLLLLVAALAIGGYAWFVERENAPSDAAETRAKVFTVESEKIDELTVRASNGTTTALKRVDGKWTIAEPASLSPDLAEVSAITTALAGVEIEKVVDEAATDLAQFSLEPPRIRVAFHMDGGASHTLDLGVKTPNGADLYARMDGGSKVFLVAAYREDAFDKSTFALRDKTVLTFERDKADYIQIAGTKSPVTLERAGQQWRLTSPALGQADFPAVDGLVGRLYQVRMKAITADDGTSSLKTYGLDKPQATVTVGAGSARSTLAIGAKADETSVYARDLAHPAVFTIDSALVQDLEQPAADFRQKDVFTFRAFTATRLEIARAGTTYVFTRTAPAADAKPAEWKLEAPADRALDATRANEMLTNFSNLRAESFADAAAAGTETVITATYGEGADASTETVTFRESKDASGQPRVHAIRKGGAGAMVVPALDFDRAMAIFKELTGAK